MELLEQFEAFYKDFKNANLSHLHELYVPHLVFRDPVHELSGVAALGAYLARSQSSVSECRFEYLDRILSGGDSVPLKCCYCWRMLYRHPRLSGGSQLTLMGASVLHLQEKILFHEDFYDMGAMLYEQVPLVGGVVSWLKKRVVGAA